MGSSLKHNLNQRKDHQVIPLQQKGLHWIRLAQYVCGWGGRDKGCMQDMKSDLLHPDISCSSSYPSGIWRQNGYSCVPGITVVFSIQNENKCIFEACSVRQRWNNMNRYKWPESLWTFGPCSHLVLTSVFGDLITSSLLSGRRVEILRSDHIQRWYMATFF